MDRSFYLDLARSGHRMPIGADLLLREHENAEALLTDGARLGQVIVEAARRYQTPLAAPLMDLMLEKEALMTLLGKSEEEAPLFHFVTPPGPEPLSAVMNADERLLTPRLRATLDAIRVVADTPDLVPCGMSIGPFSFMTKLLGDPIGGVYLAGTGATANEDPEVRAVEEALELALAVILQSVRRQVEAGAKLIILCEPAANAVYLSPRQLAKGSDIFERFVMAPNQRIKALMDELGCDLFLHDCGELTDSMVERLASLNPVILSLGSSRRLWEDAARVPDTITLYGNLPTKRFYEESLHPDEVERMTCELLHRMDATGHPFILGSECDVLSVPGRHDAIVEKVNVFLRCACDA